MAGDRRVRILERVNDDSSRRQPVPSLPIDDAIDTPPTRVVIVDDHDTVAYGLRALIEDEPGIEVVAIVRSCADAIAQAERLRPDVMLIDYRLPDGAGTDAVRTIRAMPSPPAVVMITADADRRVLAEALKAGCSGFVSKQADRDDIVASIRAAATDDSYFTRDVLKHLAHLRRFDQVDSVELGEREIEVLQLTADGLAPDEIATVLFLSPHTVKNHLRHAMTKLDAHTKLEAVVKAVRARLISIDH
jgi:two-component system NarL family response regulator